MDPKILKQLEEGDIVEVRWDDAVECSSWTSYEQVKKEKPTGIKNVGYFINFDKDCIRMCQSMSSAKEMSYSIIPIGMIRDVRLVEKGELLDWPESIEE